MLKWLSALVISAIFLCLFSPHLWATTSYRLPHPVGWMHMLPTGEMPGWSTDYWYQVELSVANVWNAPLKLFNIENEKELFYHADFEQTTFILEGGMALTDYLAFAVELPITLRAGGGLDKVIDNFHILIGADRFDRPAYDTNESVYEVRTDGVDGLSSESVSGVGSIKYKLKLWWIKWLGREKASCDCGLATSAQLKMPLSPAHRGISSGGSDYSLLWHLGIPLFDASAFWMSSGFTYAHENPLFEDWPRRKWHQMYEIGFDLSMNSRWGFIAQMRWESPLFEKNSLMIVEDAGLSNEELQEVKISSGWNSLVHWRGSQSIGLRYKSQGGSKTHFLFVEDWNLGKTDNRGTQFYVNNAPDVMFAVQFSQGF